MLKKVGIAAAAATAAMIALSPLAFAHDDDHGGETTNVWVEDQSVERDQVNRCDFDQDLTTPGAIGAAALVTQTQTGNCVNEGDAAEPADD